MSTLEHTPPAVLLALQAAIKTAIKGHEKTHGDLRNATEPDQTLENLVIGLTLEIDKVTVGHNTDKTPTASLPLLPIMGLLIKRMGATREAALQTLKEDMEEALKLNKDATKKILEESGVKDAVDKVKADVISKLPRTVVKKAVKVSGVVASVTAGQKL